MKKITLFSLGLFSISIFALGQAEEFVPGGKPIMKIYSNFHTSFSESKSGSQFQLTRVYLGYEHKFSENLSARANLDIGDPGVGKLQMTANVKNAYLKYMFNNFSVNFGMISTTQFNIPQ